MQKAFMSTPNFIKDLTDVCEQVLLNKEDKLTFLTEQMRKINLSLPATANPTAATTATATTASAAT